MPLSKFTKKQQNLFKADYGRAKEGKKTRTGMSREKLLEMIKGHR